MPRQPPKPASHPQNEVSPHPGHPATSPRAGKGKRERQGPERDRHPVPRATPSWQHPHQGPVGVLRGGGGDTGVLGSRVLCRERNGGRVGWGGCCARGGAMGAVQGRGVRVPCEGVCNGCCEVCGGVSGCCAGWGGMGAVRGGTQDAEDRRRVGEYGLEAAAAQADRDRDPDPGGLRDTRGAGHGGGCAGPGEGGWGCRSGPFKPPPPVLPAPSQSERGSTARSAPPPPGRPARLRYWGAGGWGPVWGCWAQGCKARGCTM